MHRSIVVLPLALAAFGSSVAIPASSSARTVAVKLSGGHTTDPRDHGRPVRLIAAALGVPSEVFREAFSHVQPADQGTGPTEEEARRNKDALLSRLAKYGVTNERLDEVSNFYRYNGSAGEMWPTRTARAVARVEDGKVVSVRIVSGGAGYSSTPTATVPGVGRVRVELAFGTTLTTNGRIASMYP